MINHSTIFTNKFKLAIDDMVKTSATTEKGSRARQYVSKSIQAFIEGGQNLGVSKNVDIQAFTSSADIPDPQYAVDSFVKIANWDNRYENAFKLRQFNPNQNTFEIIDISDGGLVFDEVKQGGTISIKRFSGTEIFVKAKSYGEAIGWYWEMVEDRMFSEMFDQLATFTNQALSSKSRNHYRLLTDAAFDTVLGNASVAWQGAGTDPVLTRDRLTLSLAIDTIANACRNFGFGDVATARYDVYCSPRLAIRLNDAINANLGTANGIGGIVPYNVAINPTYNLNRSSGSVLATDFIVCLSGNKIQRGDKLGLTTYQSSDNLSFSEIVTGRMRYGAAIAEPKQTIKGALA
jgi:hypothetical protein